MAFKKTCLNEIFGTVLVLSALLSTASAVDCHGKSFHCVNSTHFMICVDLGGEVSQSIDNFLIPCPPPTVCQGTNHFECEFPAPTTPLPTLSNAISETTQPWEGVVVTTNSPQKKTTKEYSEKYINTESLMSLADSFTTDATVDFTTEVALPLAIIDLHSPTIKTETIPTITESILYDTTTVPAITESLFYDTTTSLEQVTQLIPENIAASATELPTDIPLLDSSGVESIIDYVTAETTATTTVSYNDFSPNNNANLTSVTENSTAVNTILNATSGNVLDDARTNTLATDLIVGAEQSVTTEKSSTTEVNILTTDQSEFTADVVQNAINTIISEQITTTDSTIDFKNDNRGLPKISSPEAIITTDTTVNLATEQPASLNTDALQNVLDQLPITADTVFAYDSVTYKTNEDEIVSTTDGLNFAPSIPTEQLTLTTITTTENDNYTTETPLIEAKNDQVQSTLTDEKAFVIGSSKLFNNETSFVTHTFYLAPENTNTSTRNNTQKVTKQIIKLRDEAPTAETGFINDNIGTVRLKTTVVIPTEKNMTTATDTKNISFDAMITQTTMSTEQPIPVAFAENFQTVANNLIPTDTPQISATNDPILQLSGDEAFGTEKTLVIKENNAVMDVNTFNVEKITSKAIKQETEQSITESGYIDIVTEQPNTNTFKNTVPTETTVDLPIETLMITTSETSDAIVQTPVSTEQLVTVTFEENFQTVGNDITEQPTISTTNSEVKQQLTSEDAFSEINPMLTDNNNFATDVNRNSDIKNYIPIIHDTQKAITQNFVDGLVSTIETRYINDNILSVQTESTTFNNDLAIDTNIISHQGETTTEYINNKWSNVPTSIEGITNPNNVIFKPPAAIIFDPFNRASEPSKESDVSTTVAFNDNFAPSEGKYGNEATISASNLSSTANMVSEETKASGNLGFEKSDNVISQYIDNKWSNVPKSIEGITYPNNIISNPLENIIFNRASDPSTETGVSTTVAFNDKTDTVAKNIDSQTNFYVYSRDQSIDDKALQDSAVIATANNAMLPSTGPNQKSLNLLEIISESSSEPVDVVNISVVVTPMITTENGSIDNKIASSSEPKTDGNTKSTLLDSSGVQSIIDYVTAETTATTTVSYNGFSPNNNANLTSATENSTAVNTILNATSGNVLDDARTNTLATDLIVGAEQSVTTEKSSTNEVNILTTDQLDFTADVVQNAINTIISEQITTTDSAIDIKNVNRGLPKISSPEAIITTDTTVNLATEQPASLNTDVLQNVLDQLPITVDTVFEHDSVTYKTNEDKIVSTTDGLNFAMSIPTEQLTLTTITTTENDNYTTETPLIEAKNDQVQSTLTDEKAVDVVNLSVAVTPIITTENGSIDNKIASSSEPKTDGNTKSTILEDVHNIFQTIGNFFNTASENSTQRVSGDFNNQVQTETNIEIPTKPTAGNSVIKSESETSFVRPSINIIDVTTARSTIQKTDGNLQWESTAAPVKDRNFVNNINKNQPSLTVTTLAPSIGSSEPRADRVTTNVGVKIIHSEMFPVASKTIKEDTILKVKKPVTLDVFTAHTNKISSVPASTNEPNLHYIYNSEISETKITTESYKPVTSDPVTIISTTMNTQHKSLKESGDMSAILKAEESSLNDPTEITRKHIISAPSKPQITNVYKTDTKKLLQNTKLDETPYVEHVITSGVIAQNKISISGIQPGTNNVLQPTSSIPRNSGYANNTQSDLTSALSGQINVTNQSTRETNNSGTMNPVSNSTMTIELRNESQITLINGTLLLTNVNREKGNDVAHTKSTLETISSGTSTGQAQPTRSQNNTLKIISSSTTYQRNSSTATESTSASQSAIIDTLILSQNTTKGGTEHDSKLQQNTSANATVQFKHRVLVTKTVAPKIITSVTSTTQASTIPITTKSVSPVTENPKKQVANYPTLNYTCINGIRGRYSDKDDCRKFYICVGNSEPIIGHCPVNTVFSDMKKLCTKNMSHCIRENEFKCPSGGRFSDVVKENVYYVCINHKNHLYRFKFQCQRGFTLNKPTVRCIKNKEIESNESVSISSSDNVSDSSSNKISRSSSTSSTSSSGSSSSSSSSRSSSSRTSSTSSDSDSNSSNNNKNKENPEDGDDDDEEFECEKEGKFPVRNDCRRYYLCKKNRKSQYRRKLKKCESGDVFHKSKKTCVDADSYEC